jgi:hypothetical protein
MKGVSDETASRVKPLLPVDPSPPYLGGPASMSLPAGLLMPAEPATVDADLAPLRPAHIVVFEMMHAQGSPLTMRQIVRLTTLPQAEVQMVLEALHDHGMVRRLETVIVSYVTAL